MNNVVLRKLFCLENGLPALTKGTILGTALSVFKDAWFLHKYCKFPIRFADSNYERVYYNNGVCFKTCLVNHPSSQINTDCPGYAGEGHMLQYIQIMYKRRCLKRKIYIYFFFYLLKYLLDCLFS